jgi:hypothetical protein
MPVPAPPATVSQATFSSVSVTEVSGRLARLGSAAAASWSEDDLAFYIREEIGRLHGPQLPCSGEDRILREFWQRFGADGVLIARAAFEAMGGMYMGAPVTVRRFSSGHDEFFSLPVLRDLGVIPARP